MSVNTEYRFFKISPRGFRNEVTYYRVTADRVEEINAAFADYEDDGSGRYACWTRDRAASKPGVALDWDGCA